MILNRSIGLRVTLFAFMITDLVLGIMYYVGPPARFSGPAFGTALDVAPLHVWGVVFALEAVWLALAWNHRGALAVGLFFGMLLYLFWSFCFILSATHSPYASYTGGPTWALSAVVQAGCLAAVLGPRLRR